MTAHPSSFSSSSCRPFPMASALTTPLLFLLFIAASSFPSDEEVRQLHQDWMAEHRRSYSTLLEEEERFKVFKDNLRYIDEHNAAADRGEYSFRLGLTPFADFTDEELPYSEPCYLPGPGEGMASSLLNNSQTLQDDYKLPESVDWRAKGAVTSVKDQAKCASCWAFSAVATVEGMNKIVNGKLIELSAKELVDCVNSGCKGGTVLKAFEHIVKNGGISSEKEYPYNLPQGDCKTKKKVASIVGFEGVSGSNELALKSAVARQPVSVVVDGRSKDFRIYKSGIFDSSKYGTQLSHVMTIVGYGSDKGEKYWIVKNSWGRSWGESGYMKMKRTDAPNTPGACGIALRPAFPIMKAAPTDPLLSGNYEAALEML